jgi:hypothetical protein
MLLELDWEDDELWLDGLWLEGLWLEELWLDDPWLDGFWLWLEELCDPDWLVGLDCDGVLVL